MGPLRGITFSVVLLLGSWVMCSPPVGLPQGGPSKRWNGRGLLLKLVKLCLPSNVKGVYSSCRHIGGRVWGALELGIFPDRKYGISALFLDLKVITFILPKIVKFSL